MDRVLPRCTALERLFVSASEISINVFIIVPPCLKHLRIQAYNHLATFYFTGRLIAHLEDMVSPSTGTSQMTRVADVATSPPGSS